MEELWDIAIRGFADFANKDRSLSTLSFNTSLEEGNRAVLSIFPHRSDAESGLAVTLVLDHLSRGFGIEENDIRLVCGDPIGESFGGSYSTAENCYFLKKETLERLLRLITEAVHHNGK